MKKVVFMFYISIMYKQHFDSKEVIYWALFVVGGKNKDFQIKQVDNSNCLLETNSEVSLGGEKRNAN